MCWHWDAKMCETRLAELSLLKHACSVMQQGLVCLQGHDLVLSQQNDPQHLLIQLPEALAATMEAPTDAGMLPLNIVQRLCWPPMPLQEHASSSMQPTGLPTEGSHGVHIHTGVLIWYLACKLSFVTKIVVDQAESLELLQAMHTWKYGYFDYLPLSLLGLSLPGTRPGLPCNR